MHVSEIAGFLNATFIGEDRQIEGVSTLDNAKPSDITFLANSKYTDKALHTEAGAIIVKGRLPNEHVSQIITDNPYLAFARVVRLFVPEKSLDAGISDAAFVHPDAIINKSAAIYPFVYVGKHAKVGDRCVIYPHCYVGEGVVIGQGTVLYPNVVVYDGCEIGKRCIIHSGVVIGSDGFGFAWDGQRHFKVPQVGKVIIEDEVEIGSNCTIDRAALAETRIGTDVKMDNLVQVGHNVVIGEHTIIVSQTGIAGSARIGRNVILAGQCGVGGHIKVGDNSIAGARTGIAKDVKPGMVISGYPAMDHKKWLRVQNVYKDLPEMLKRLNDLEKRIDKIDKH